MQSLPRDMIVQLLSVMDNEYDKVGFALTCKGFYDIYDNLRERAYKKNIKCQALSVYDYFFRYVVKQDIEYIISYAYSVITAVEKCENVIADNAARRLFESDGVSIFVFGIITNNPYENTNIRSKRTIKPLFKNNKLIHIEIWVNEVVIIDITEHKFTFHKYDAELFVPSYGSLYGDYIKYIKYSPLPEFLKKMYIEAINFIHNNYYVKIRA